jgi:hypothetical protein
MSIPQGCSFLMQHDMLLSMSARNQYVVKKERVIVSPFLSELYEYVIHYGWDEKRAKHVSVQKETKAVSLRDVSSQKWFVRNGDLYSFHSQMSSETRNAKQFPLLMQFLYCFAKRENATLSRVMIVSLLPKKQVYPHIDFGEYYEVRNRHHLVLDSSGSKMVTGGEVAIFTSGDLFYFNNHVTHEAFNESDQERIHVIFDLLPNNYRVTLKVCTSKLKTLLRNAMHYAVNEK